MGLIFLVILSDLIKYWCNNYSYLYRSSESHLVSSFWDFFPCYDFLIILGLWNWPYLFLFLFKVPKRRNICGIPISTLARYNLVSNNIAMGPRSDLLNDISAICTIFWSAFSKSRQSVVSTWQYTFHYCSVSCSISLQPEFCSDDSQLVWILF